MRTILDLLDYENYGSIFIAVLLLIMVARVMADGRPKVFLWSYRLAAAAMLAHATLLWIDWSPTRASVVVGVIFHSMVTGAITLNISKIVLSALSSLYSLTWEPAAHSARRRRAQLRDEQERRQREHVEAERRRLEQAAWERGAPERERQRQRAAEQAKMAALAQQRRVQARLDCELYYALYAPEIHQRFSPADFKRFVKRYMNDDMQPSEVESRGRQLQEIIKQHTDRCQPPRKFNSFGDIDKWYSDQTSQAERIGDDRLRRSVLAQLKGRYIELTKQLMEEVQP